LYILSVIYAISLTKTNRFNFIRIYCSSGSTLSNERA